MDDLKRYKRALGNVLEALQVYADPETYHAIAFMADRPAGEFADDFSKVPGSGYDRPMPGKRARKALLQMERVYGDLKIL